MPRARRPPPVPQFNPETLRTLCLDVITLNLNTISSVIELRDLRELHKHVNIPVELSEGILSTYTENGLPLTDTVLHAFRNTSKTRLHCVDLSNSQISDWGLQWISCHPLTRIGEYSVSFILDKAFYSRFNLPSILHNFTAVAVDLLSSERDPVTKCRDNGGKIVLEIINTCIQSIF